MKTALCTTVVLGTLWLMSSVAAAAQCSGSYRVLQNYNPGSGGVCASLGLNTHQAVCQPGQRYATYCDDASGGRYRTCQSRILCSHDQRGSYGNGGFSEGSSNSRDERWDSRDYQGYDHQNSRERYQDDRRYKSQDCTQWDFSANRPCAAGTINRDCQKGCDGR